MGELLLAPSFYVTTFLKSNRALIYNESHLDQGDIFVLICSSCFYFNTQVEMSLRHSSENKFKNQLSSKELLAISKEISLLFSPYIPAEIPCLNTELALPAQQLLDVSESISLYYSPKIFSSTNKLVILPIDPQHIYVYWDLVDNQDTALSQSIVENEISLRVYAQSGENDYSSSKEGPVVEIPIHAVQAQERIKLPLLDGVNSYSASVGRSTKKVDFVPFLNTKSSHEIPAHSAQYKCDESVILNEQPLFVNTSPVKPHYPYTNHSAIGKKRHA